MFILVILLDNVDFMCMTPIMVTMSHEFDSYNGNNESYELMSLLYFKDHSHDMEIKYI